MLLFNIMMKKKKKKKATGTMKFILEKKRTTKTRK